MGELLRYYLGSNTYIVQYLYMYRSTENHRYWLTHNYIIALSFSLSLSLSLSGGMSPSFYVQRTTHNCGDKQ